MQEILFNQLYYYSLVNDTSNFVTINVELDEKIDDGCMEKAIKRAAKRFPYFQMKLVEQQDRIMFEQNLQEVKLYKYEEGRPFCFADNNDYLYRFSTENQMLYLGFTHGIADAGSAMAYIKTVLYEYYKEIGEKITAPKDLYSIDSEVCDEETVNPYDRVPSDLKPHKSEKVVFYQLPEKQKQKNGYRIFKFAIKAEQLMKLAKENDGSPNSLTALILSKAIRNVHEDIGDEKIGISVAVNAKPILNVPKSAYPCLHTAICEFDNKFDNMDITKQNTIIRGRIILQSDEMVIVPKLAGMVALDKYFLQIPDKETKKAMSRNIISNQGVTADISYVGRVDWGGMEKHIKSCYTYTDIASLIVEINYVNGMFFYAFTQRFDDDCYVREFCNIMDKYGIEHTDIESMELYKNYFDLGN